MSELGWAWRVRGAGVWRRLVAAGSLRPGKFLLALGVLALLGAVVFGPNVRNGGFYNDDWWLAATYRLGPPPGYVHAVEEVRHAVGGRPLLAWALPLPYAAFGSNAALHIGLAVAPGVLVSTAFFALLRVLGLESFHSIMIAALALVFPWSDAVRLWSIAGFNQLSVVLYLAGASTALGGMRLRGKRAAVVHAVAMSLYGAALLTYEAVAGLVLTSGLLYLVLARGAWRSVWPRWLADILISAIVLAWAANATAGVRETPSVRSMASDLPSFTREALTLVGHAMSTDGPGLVPALFALAVVVSLVARGLPSDPAARRDLRRWLVVAVVASVELGAAFAPFVGSGLYPLGSGYGNRGNIAVALPLTALVYAFAAAAALIVAPRREAARAPALVMTAVIAAAVTFGLRPRCVLTSAAGIARRSCRIASWPLSARRCRGPHTAGSCTSMDFRLRFRQVWLSSPRPGTSPQRSSWCGATTPSRPTRS